MPAQLEGLGSYPRSCFSSYWVVAGSPQPGEYNSQWQELCMHNWKASETRLDIRPWDYKTFLSTNLCFKLYSCSKSYSRFSFSCSYSDRVQYGDFPSKLLILLKDILKILNLCKMLYKQNRSHLVYCVLQLKLSKLRLD